MIENTEDIYVVVVPGYLDTRKIAMIGSTSPKERAILQIMADYPSRF